MDRKTEGHGHRTDIHRILARERRQLRNRIVENVKLALNLAHYYIDYYIVNRFQYAIHNDLGASFTAVSRQGNRIRKAAEPAGEAKLRDEIEWMLMFKDSDFSRFFPLIHDYSLEPGSVFYEMKYYNYPNLRRIIISEMNAPFFIRLRLRYLLEVLRSELWIEAHSTPCPEDFVRTEHFGKFASRKAQVLKAAPWFSTYLEPPFLSINGRRYPNADVLLRAIEADPAMTASLKPELLYWSHGDIHCNNILCGTSWTNMILIDCRGKSSSGSLHYDVAYDVGKLLHDFNSLYSLIERHNYSIFHVPGTGSSGTPPEIEFSILDRRGQANFHKYRDFIRVILEEEYLAYGNLLERADFVEAMLFLTMIPMHIRLKDEGLMCYVTGLLRLNEWMAKYHPDRYAATLASLGLGEDPTR